jgi:hypothetical protein
LDENKEINKNIMSSSLNGNSSDRNVRVYTVNMESRFIIIENVPALGVIKDLLKRLSLYGKIIEYRLLDHLDDRPKWLQKETEEDEYMDVVYVEYETINNARHAKIRGVKKPFFGQMLRISYAPEYESAHDTKQKLDERRNLITKRAIRSQQNSQQRTKSKDQALIGPQLPPQKVVPVFKGVGGLVSSGNTVVDIIESKPASRSLKIEQKKRRRI